jgi:hypothetical protein
MAITQTACTVFKTNLLKGDEDFNSGSAYTYKIALYTADASLDADTTVYSATNEVSGSGYTATGNTLTPLAPLSSDTTAYISFANTSWASASFTCRGALIYNSTTGAAVCVLDFGSDKTVVNQTFTVTFPTANASSAIIRIA